MAAQNDSPRIWYSRECKHDQNGTDVPAWRGEQSAAGTIRRCTAHDAGRGRVPTNLALVRLQTAGYRSPGALYARNHARAGATQPLDTGTDRRVYFGAKPLSVLTEVARRGRGGSAETNLGSGHRRRRIHRRRDSRSGNIRADRKGEGALPLRRESERLLTQHYSAGHGTVPRRWLGR